MNYYPLYLDIRNKLCVVIGGGNVAFRKARVLLSCGAHVRVVSPRIIQSLARLSDMGDMEIVPRAYHRNDIEGAALIFATTGDELVNRQIRDDAAESNIPVNVVDAPGLCSFIVPALVTRGPITIAISTGGSAPGIAKRLKEEINKVLPREYMKHVSIVADFRRRLISRVEKTGDRQAVLKRVYRLSVEEINALGVKGLERRFLKKGP